MENSNFTIDTEFFCLIFFFFFIQFLKPLILYRPSHQLIQYTLMSFRDGYLSNALFFFRNLRKLHPFNLKLTTELNYIYCEWSAFKNSLAAATSSQEPITSNWCDDAMSSFYEEMQFEVEILHWKTFGYISMRKSCI